MNIYVARPGSDGPDFIYPIAEENETYYISNTGKKFPKKVVDTEKPWHNNYYFSSQEKENSFYEKFYKEPVELDFENLFYKALNHLTDVNGGNLDSALYDMGIQFESDTGKAIRKWFGWEDSNEE